MKFSITGEVALLGVGKLRRRNRFLGRFCNCSVFLVVRHFQKEMSVVTGCCVLYDGWTVESGCVQSGIGCVFHFQQRRYQRR